MFGLDNKIDCIVRKFGETVDENYQISLRKLKIEVFVSKKKVETQPKSVCFTKTYNLLSLISFNLEELVTAEIQDVKDYAKVIVNNFNAFVDILLQVTL